MVIGLNNKGISNVIITLILIAISLIASVLLYYLLFPMIWGMKTHTVTIQKVVWTSEGYVEIHIKNDDLQTAITNIKFYYDGEASANEITSNLTLEGISYPINPGQTVVFRTSNTSKYLPLTAGSEHRLIIHVTWGDNSKTRHVYRFTVRAE